jgi:hypothetical protein
MMILKILIFTFLDGKQENRRFWFERQQKLPRFNYILISSGMKGNSNIRNILFYNVLICFDTCDGEFGGMKIGRGNRSTGRKPAPAPLCPPQIPLDQTRYRTRAAAVGSQRLNPWAMARPWHLWLYRVQRKGCGGYWIGNFVGTAVTYFKVARTDRTHYYGRDSKAGLLQFELGVVISRIWRLIWTKLELQKATNSMEPNPTWETATSPAT